MQKRKYLLKAVVSPAVADVVQEKAKELNTSLAEFLRDALAYYLLAINEAEKGNSPAFVDPDGNMVSIASTKLEMVKSVKQKKSRKTSAQGGHTISEPAAVGSK